MKQILYTLIALLTALPLTAQKPSARAYPNGIYLSCGTEIPHNFSYLVEKAGPSGAWETVAELRAPATAAALKANLLGLPLFFKNSMPLPTNQSDFIFERLQKSLITDSLFAYALDPKVLAAVGCGWFDDGLTGSGTHQYRISKVNASGTLPLATIQQTFPQENPYKGTLYTMRFIPEGESVTIFYGLTDTLSTYHIKLYRSRLQENDFSETSANTGYTTLREQTVAVVQDETATKGLAYSYVAIPYDALGHMGTPSDTIHIYNLTKDADIGFPENLRAVADKEKQGVSISWSIRSDMYVLGYELYRSSFYDGDYTRIAMLPPGTTSYFDTEVNPALAYYYYVTVNNGYGSSLPSARVPVILDGAEKNILPPQNVSAVLEGNVVTLTFESIDPDTRGFQVFRANGYTGPMTLIASLYGTADLVCTYTDTLTPSLQTQTYSYAIADVNSSNKVSPLSNRVSVQLYSDLLSAPSGVNAQLRGNEIFVLWDNMTQQFPNTVGYNLYRTTVENGDTETAPQRIATLPMDANCYTDTALTPGTHYRYTLESIGRNDELSNRSMHVGIIVPMELPLSPRQLLTFASSDRISLRWDNPSDPTVTAIRIYRASSSTPATLLKELPPTQSTYEDPTPKPGEQYYYYVVTVNARNEESPRDEPVGARIRR